MFTVGLCSTVVSMFKTTLRYSVERVFVSQMLDQWLIPFKQQKSIELQGFHFKIVQFHLCSLSSKTVEIIERQTAFFLI